MCFMLFKRVNKTWSPEFVQKLSDSQWVQKLAYLSNIFLRLNLLNLSLGGRFYTVIDFMDKPRTFNMREIFLFASNLFNKLPLKTQKTMILHFEIKQSDNKPYISNKRALLRCDEG